MALLLPPFVGAPALAQDPEPEPPAPVAAAPAAAPTLTPELLEPFRYRLIGPANMAGRVTAIDAPDLPGRKTIYVGYATGGVWTN